MSEYILVAVLPLLLVVLGFQVLVYDPLNY